MYTSFLSGKIAADSKNNEISFEKAASDIKDSVRYTALFENEDFTKGYNEVKSSLESKGYKEERCKNFFKKYDEGKADIKSVQCVYSNKSGDKFELQFQTYETQGAKEISHPMYEESRALTTTESRKAELKKATIKLYSNASTPEGANDINDY